MPSEPYGHSYFRRESDAAISPDSRVIEYSYAILASAQLPKLGYRRVVRRLWQTLGHPQLLRSVDLQRNVRRAGIGALRRVATSRPAPSQKPVHGSLLNAGG